MDAGSPPRPLRTARRLICRAPPCTANAARRAVQKPGVCASLSQLLNRAALRDDFKQKHTPPFRSAHRRKSGYPHRERLQRGAPYIRPTPPRNWEYAYRRLCAGTGLLFATVSSRSTLPRSDLRIAGKAGVRTESGSSGALLMHGQRRPPCRSEAGNMRIVVSAPEQSCSSRRFQAEAHSPVPICASPGKRVSAQEAAPSGRSLYTANAARRAAQKPE